MITTQSANRSHSLLTPFSLRLLSVGSPLRFWQRVKLKLQPTLLRTQGESQVQVFLCAIFDITGNESHQVVIIYRVKLGVYLQNFVSQLNLFIANYEFHVRRFGTRLVIASSAVQSIRGRSRPLSFISFLLFHSLLSVWAPFLSFRNPSPETPAIALVELPNMVEFEETKQAKIKWGDGDVEAANLRRRNSISELSIRSVHSRRASIDPSVALPPTFRTLSYQIDDAKGAPMKSQKGKDAAKGILSNIVVERRS